MQKEIIGQKLQLYGEVVQGASNISKLAKDWDDLFTRAQEAPAFLSRAWAETFISEKRIRGIPLLIVVWAGSKLVALLPLSVRSFYGIRVAEPIGIIGGAYLGLLADLNYTGAVQAVADVWVRERVAHAFYDKYLSSLDEVTNELIAEFGRRGFVYKRGFRRVCPWIRLGCSFDEYFRKTASSKSRQNLRRRERRLFESGDVKVEHYVAGEVTPEVLLRIAGIEQQSWLRRRGAAVLYKPFHQKLLLKMAQAGFGSVWLMTIHGADAAFEYVFITHRRLQFGWRTFTLKYTSSMSIGQILMMHVIRDACNSGILSMDIGMGASEYKRFWARDKHYVERVVAGKGFWGYTAVLCYKVMWWLAEQKWLFSLYRRFKKWRNISEQEQFSSSERETVKSG